MFFAARYAALAVAAATLVFAFDRPELLEPIVAGTIPSYLRHNVLRLIVYAFITAFLWDFFTHQGGRRGFQNPGRAEILSRIAIAAFALAIPVLMSERLASQQPQI